MITLSRVALPAEVQNSAGARSGPWQKGPYYFLCFVPQMIVLRAHARLLTERSLTRISPPRSGSSSSASLENPFIVLGVSYKATKEEIRERYLTLAKQHHPDASSARFARSSARFARISAAYNILSDPQRRAAAEMELQDPTDHVLKAASASVLMCRSGRTGHGLAHMADALMLWDSYDGSSTPQSDPSTRDLAKAASLVLELSAARGEPHHRPATRIWTTLRRWGVADSRACQAYFALALRGGHTPDAMRALRHAEQHDLEQSTLMLNTARQVRRYKQRQS
jgi:DnaJ-domain-containing protein 1